MFAIKDATGRWAEWRGGARPSKLDDGALFTLPHPTVVEASFSPEDLDRYDLAKVIEVAPPQGKFVASYTLGDLSGTPIKMDVYEDIPIVFPELTSRQLWRALAILEEDDAVEAAIEALPRADRREAQNATKFERDHPLIISLAPLMDLTDSQLDDVWLWAATL